MNKNVFKSAFVGMTLLAVASGCGKGSGQNIKIDGVTGPNVTFVNGQFLMSVGLTNVNLEGGGRFPIPHMPNSFVEVGPDLQSNGMLISIGLDPNDLNELTGGNVNLLPPQTLPGGRALPGVSGGQLPAVAVQVPKWDNMVFYVGPQIFGVFVPVKLNMQGYMATFRFYDSNNKQVGNISLVGEDTNKENAGFLVLIPIKGQVQQIMKAAKVLN
jgi:hypothetical protein